jgi:Ribbon-helix-helix protein, copG family
MPETILREKTSDKTLVQLKLPPGLVDDVDRLAAEEMISRTAWIRRLLLNATRKAKTA